MSSGSLKKNQVSLLPGMHGETYGACSPAGDVILVAPYQIQPVCPTDASGLIALLCTCSFSGGPGTLAPGASATSSLYQDTGRPVDRQQSPSHSLRGPFLMNTGALSRIAYPVFGSFTCLWKVYLPDWSLHPCTRPSPTGVP